MDSGDSEGPTRADSVGVGNTSPRDHSPPPPPAAQRARSSATRTVAAHARLKGRANTSRRPPRTSMHPLLPPGSPGCTDV